MSTQSHKIILVIPGPTSNDGRTTETVELYTIPRIGEVVLFHGLEYKVFNIVNNIKKYSGFFGWCGLYRNVITVILSQEVD